VALGEIGEGFLDEPGAGGTPKILLGKDGDRRTLTWERGPALRDARQKLPYPRLPFESASPPGSPSHARNATVTVANATTAARNEQNLRRS
jgi:hypothetical protein